MSDTYVCSELVENVCKTWVLQPPSLMQSLMITKADSLAISTSLAGLFAVIMGFLIIAKVGKLL